MMAGDGQQILVPPGFRFHPTDEELLYYYLRKKLSYEAIDLDVIREVDLNKLEPWDLKEKCRIGSGDQNEWYFFSHKDKKYPTGSRTNRATRAGFWKATGRDKAIQNNGSCSWNSKRIIIGMRKTLVFYTGRAPHGQKTDWIMHEYRLDDRHFNNTPVPEVQQEDGWVVCRVFKKKNIQNRSQLAVQPEDEDHIHMMNKLMGSVSAAASDEPKQAHYNTVSSMFDHGGSSNYNMHLPQLLTSPPPPPHDRNITSLMLSSDQDQDQDQGEQNLNNPSCTNSDWSFLDKLLASHHHHQHTTVTHQTKFNHLLLQHSSSANATTPPPHDVFSFHHFGHLN